jgi:hypothetical protein
MMFISNSVAKWPRHFSHDGRIFLPVLRIFSAMAASLGILSEPQNAFAKSGCGI